MIPWGIIVCSQSLGGVLSAAMIMITRLKIPISIISLASSPGRLWVFGSKDYNSRLEAFQLLLFLGFKRVFRLPGGSVFNR